MWTRSRVNCRHLSICLNSETTSDRDSVELLECSCNDRLKVWKVEQFLIECRKTKTKPNYLPIWVFSQSQTIVKPKLNQLLWVLNQSQTVEKPKPKPKPNSLITFKLTIGSCFSVHYRVMEHAGSLESTKEASWVLSKLPKCSITR